MSQPRSKRMEVFVRVVVLYCLALGMMSPVWCGTDEGLWGNFWFFIIFLFFFLKKIVGFLSSFFLLQN